jgi:hypothetical protein
MAACGAKNFHKVNFDLSAVWLDFASVLCQNACPLLIVLHPLPG